MTDLEAIVFDLDGLMVDSEPAAQQAWERVLKGYGRVLDDETFAGIVGMRITDSVHTLREKYDLEASPDELLEQEKIAFSEISAGGLSPMAGLSLLVAEIQERHIPWAVATSSRRDYALTILNHLELTSSCGAIAAGDEVLHGKPAPDIYLLAAERLSVQPEKCLALEDSVPGARAALAAGMVTVAVPNGYTRPEDFVFADHVFGSLEGVADNLDRLLG